MPRRCLRRVFSRTRCLTSATRLAVSYISFEPPFRFVWNCDVGVTVVTILLSLESVFAVIAGAIILKQQMTVREYIGCAIMFAAVILAQIQFPTRQKAE